MPIVNDAPARNARGLAALRIAIGVLFVVFGEYKITSPMFVFGGGFEGWIHRFLDGGEAYPFMVPILRHMVLANARPIAVLVAGGECAIGLSLVLGIWTRAASAAGAVYMLALLFSSNYPGPHAPAWQYFGAALDHLVPALCFVSFLLGAPESRWAIRRKRAASTGAKA